MPILTITSLVSNIYSQDDWKTYNTEDGLADNWVSSIAVDHNNVIYFGTLQGISRFDGSDWTTITTDQGLPYNSISSIAVESDWCVWASTYYENNLGQIDYAGISKYDGQECINYTTSSGLADNRVNSIAIADDGKVWAAIAEGISCFDGDTWTNFTTSDGLYSNYVSHIETTSNGGIWCAFDVPMVLSHFDGEEWITFTDVLGLPKEIITSIASGENNEVWFSTSNGLGHYDLENWSLFTTEDGLGQNYLESVEVGPNGTVWVGAHNNDSVAVCSFDGSNWNKYSTEDGVAQNYVISISVDNAGTVWAGTGGRGVSYLKTTSTYINVPGNPKINDFSILGSYPNPFNMNCCIQFFAPYQGKSTLSIYNLLGELIYVNKFSVPGQGKHKVYWDGKDIYGQEVSSGIYFTRLQFESQVKTLRLLLTK